MNRRCLVKMEHDGVSLFRINLSHTRLEDLPNVIGQIQGWSDVPICIDTEGAQLRTGYLKGGSRKLPAGSLLVIRSQTGLSASFGTALRRLSAEVGIAVNHLDVLSDIRVGEMIYLDFGSTSVQVIEKLEAGELLCRVVIGGTIGSNKAVNLETPIVMPALTKKDLAAIPIAREHGIRHFALSFAQSAEDVCWMRRQIGDEAFLISKVESNRGLENLRDIIRESDAILIDRGDLSREQPISKIPFWQKRITKAVKEGKKELYVATNLLESMITSSAPTRAEVNDIANTLLDGADGLVLAAETAIGRNPLASVSILKSVIDEYVRFQRDGGPRLDHADSRLIEPHGGTLCRAPRLERTQEPPPPVEDAIALHHHQYLDFLQLTHGVFSPLRGFMSAAELESVLEHGTLPDGTVWPMPILLQIPSAAFDAAVPGARLPLSWEDTVVGYVTVADKYDLDLAGHCRRLFGTDSIEHPGAAYVQQGGPHVVAGKVEIYDDIRFSAANWELSPRQSRNLFEMKGWSQVVGFHTRNPPNLAHQFLQKQAFAETFADGLFISPVSGPPASGTLDVLQTTQCYNELTMSKEYESIDVVIGSFPSYVRFAGPREAIFDALCHQNHGCTHFVVGPHHARLGQEFDETELQAAIAAVQDDVSIKFVVGSRVYYCVECGRITESCTHPQKDRREVSGSRVTEILRGGDHFQYPMISDIVRDFLATMPVPAVDATGPAEPRTGGRKGQVQ